MSRLFNRLFGRQQRWRYWIVVGLIALVIGGVFAVFRRAPRGPALLNQPTKAREERPFTTEPDPRFAPLPFEPEKHGK
jgi:hypothetical protein